MAGTLGEGDQRLLRNRTLYFTPLRFDNGNQIKLDLVLTGAPSNDRASLHGLDYQANTVKRLLTCESGKQV